jgi:processive 1,2-diacylglycerol beta-glucosyltransferase
MITGLLDSGMRGTLIVVAGRNEELKDGIAELQSNDTLTLWKLGFVDFLDDLITGSDLVITKAGGLIVSEIMARGTPMVVIDPIPGQEHWNADYIVSVGAGVQVRLAEMIPSVVKSLLDDPERLELMREKSSEAGRPSAAFTVADSVLEVVQRERVTQA